MVAGTLVVHSVPTEASTHSAGTRTFTAAAGGVSTSSQVTIHVIALNKTAPLPIVSYSIFGIVGFLAVLAVALLLRRYQNPRRKLKQ